MAAAGTRLREGDWEVRAVVDVAGGMVGPHPATDVDLSAGTQWRDLDLLVSFRRATQDLSGLALPATSPAPTIPEYNTGARTARGLDQTSWTALAKLTYHARQGTDLGLFASSYLKTNIDPGYLAYFDFNNDNQVDVADLGPFASRYLTTLP